MTNTQAPISAGIEHYPLLETKVGDYVILDGGRIGELLLPGCNNVCPGGPGCGYRYPCPATSAHGIGCNILITGRTGQRRPYSDGVFIRIQIEWVGDCEPSTYSRGWLLLT